VEELVMFVSWLASLMLVKFADIYIISQQIIDRHGHYLYDCTENKKYIRAYRCMHFRKTPKSN